MTYDEIRDAYRNGEWLCGSAMMNEKPSTAFVFDDYFYFLDGEHYWWFDEMNKEFRIVSDPKDGTVDHSTYIPTTTIARKPMGGGTSTKM